jgi:caffeoyl-CoA O-methyltransferase
MIFMSDNRNQIIDYIEKKFVKEDFLLNNILALQESNSAPMINIGPDQAKFINLLIKLIRPRRVLEIGSYYGYSAVSLGRAIRDLNSENENFFHKLYCIEASENYANIVRDHISQAELENDVEVIHGTALEIMRSFIEEEIKFDMVFIDADKANYSNYLNLSSELLWTGGLLLADNCLWKGKIFDSEPDKTTKAILDFNDALSNSQDFDSVLLTIQDGLAFGVRK